MPAMNRFDNSSEKPATGKRKRAPDVDYADSGDASDKENISSKTAQPAKKRQARTPATVKTTTASKPKKNDDVKAAKKLCSETLKAIDKRVDELDKKVKTMSGNSRSITTASYAVSAGKHLNTFKKLAAMDQVLAFNLLLSMADASHTDLDVSFKMCGTTDDASTPTFKKLDEALLPLIDTRDSPSERAGELPSVPHRWTRKDADVGPFKCGYPNAQQRNQMYRQKLAWEKVRRAARRARRDGVPDWVAIALSDLKEERDYLAAYGVNGYLPLSIAKLEAYNYRRNGEEAIDVDADADVAFVMSARILERSTSHHVRKIRTCHFRQDASASSVFAG